MSLYQQHGLGSQQRPLGMPRRSIYAYDEDFRFSGGYDSMIGLQDDRSDHPMDRMYLDNTRKPTVPPYLKALPNTGEDSSFPSKAKDSSLESGAKNGDNGSEEADAAAGITSTPRNVLKKVTSLSGLMSSSSLSALARGSSEEGSASASASTPSRKSKGKSNKTDHGSKTTSSSSATMLNRYYHASNDNIHNNPNHRNYRHHMYLRNMNMAKEGSMASFPTPPSQEDTKPSWRLRDRMKTVGMGLIMALNVGTDPPDVIKPHPCAKLQCWMDPSSVTRAKAKERIGERLEKQYARWQQQRGSSSSRSFKTRKALDPTVEDVRALCLWLRKQARHERILLHYNGHGVPRPTPNGEIWVFDKNHTEYIPLSVSDLRQWAGKPTIVILDCSSAGVLVPFLTAPPAETPTNTPPRVSSPILNGSGGSLMEPQRSSRVPPMDDPIITTMDEAASHWVKDTIVLCPTSEGEWLPMNPEYPADIFTACLTTPIHMALRWFVRNNRISMGRLFTNDGPDRWVDSIPGQANDRKTPLGELNWIFTSVTDSIAWNVLPKPLFQRLFRQDLLVASMFRNFLLADRILRSLNCTPQSYPPLPPGVADHPLWQAWDLACETCLFGLIKDGILGDNHGLQRNLSSRASPSTNLPLSKGSVESEPPRQQHERPGVARPETAASQQESITSTTRQYEGQKLSSVSSPFFSEQLTGFEVWLEYAAIHKGNLDHLQPPEQLPVVLQVLLSQAHRVRALELLRRFLELGSWTVNLALSLGIFPYVMKLLQSAEYKTVLVNIWASILKFDPSCQVDLSKDKSLKHFIQPFAQWSERTSNEQTQPPTREVAKERTLIAFCLASVCYKYPNAQSECLRQNLHGSCASLLSAQIKLREQQKQQEQEADPTSRRASQDATQYVLLPSIAREWICLCLGNLIQGFHLAQTQVYNIGVHELLIVLQQSDDDQNVRAAAAYALGNLLGHVSLPSSSSSASLSKTSSQGRLQPGPPPPPVSTMGTSIMGSPTPIHLGPQAFANSSTIHPTGGVLSRQGQFQPPQKQMFLPTTGLSVATGMTAPNAFQGQLQQTPQGPASAALNAAMSSAGGLGITQQQLQSLPHPQQQQQLSIPNPIAQKVQPGVAPMLSSQGQGMPRVMPTLVPQNQKGVVGIGDQLSGSGQPLLRATSGPQLGGGHQGSIFHPQRTNLPSIGGGYLGSNASNPIGIVTSPNGPVGMPIIGSPLGIGASAVGSPIAMKQMRGTPSLNEQHHQQQQPRRRPTIYEDRRRIEFDLKVMEAMTKGLTGINADGSATVRYEIVMGLSNFVEKYLRAILVIAEDATRVMDRLRLGNIPEDTEGDESGSHNHSRKRVVALPEGMNQMMMKRFEACWKTLRTIQHHDPHPNVSEAANKIVCVVHETLYDLRMELEVDRPPTKEGGGLSGIQEEGEGSDGFDRVKSDANLSMVDTSLGILEDRSLSIKPKPHPLRRSVSDAGGNFNAINMSDAKILHSLSMPGRNLMDRVKSESLLPKSELYQWKKSIFKPDYDDDNDEDQDDRDPLNPSVAARNYQNRRNAMTRASGKKLARHFEGLRPRRRAPKSSVNMMLDNDKGQENEDNNNNNNDEELLQSDLRLKEKRLLRNTGGGKMTSMLKFHSYENALVVGDNQDYVTVWDYETGERKSAFKNGNPSESRMTSAFWINESSSSLLFVGCDDGSARIWGGIVGNSGEISSQSPTLESSFFAVPNMEAGQRNKSGLICEWQQSTGRLIAGGNSRHLRCWDMKTEQCARTIDIEADSCITAMTTAYDEEGGGFRGNGPEIIVAGFADGTLKLFDIRMSNSAVAAAMEPAQANSRGKGRFTGGNRRRQSLNQKTFSEHGSWIVDISFQSYGSSNEILSGSVAGDIRAWDIRSSSRSLRAIDVQRGPMTALSVHKKIPIAATGSHAQFIKILTLEGDTLQVARFHEGSLSGHRIGPVSCLEFHKEKLVLAAGSTNALVSVYQPKRPRP